MIHFIRWGRSFQGSGLKKHIVEHKKISLQCGDYQVIVRKSWKFLKKSCWKIWFVLVFCSTFATANGKNGACESRSLRENWVHWNDCDRQGTVRDKEGTAGPATGRRKCNRVHVNFWFQGFLAHRYKAINLGVAGQEESHPRRAFSGWFLKTEKKKRKR